MRIRSARRLWKLGMLSQGAAFRAMVAQVSLDFKHELIWLQFGMYWNCNRFWICRNDIYTILVDSFVHIIKCRLSVVRDVEGDCKSFHHRYRISEKPWVSYHYRNVQNVSRYNLGSQIDDIDTEVDYVKFGQSAEEGEIQRDRYYWYLIKEVWLLDQ